MYYAVPPEQEWIIHEPRGGRHAVPAICPLERSRLHLGLPDEYQDQYPHPIGTNVHSQWRALCAQAGVNPNAAPSFNQSIMSCGWTTSACHFVTIWDSLGRLTNIPPYNVQRTDWVIERGSQPDVL